MRIYKLILSSFFLLTLVIGFGLKYTNLITINTGNESTSTGVKRAEAWFNGYDYRKTITLDEAEITGTTNLTNFPVLISFTDSSLRTTGNGGRVTNASGYDIIFTDTSDTQLNHEIESYNATTGQIVMWVKIPTLSYNVDTDIYMYYGNSGVSTSQENVNGVWGNSYVGVWHLGANLNDSTSNSLNASNPNSATTGVAAVAGNGITVNGAQRLTVANNSVMHPSAVTVSMWVKRNGAQNSYGKPFYNGQISSDPYGVFGFQTNNTSDTQFGFQVSGNSATQYTVPYSSVSLTDATWYYFAGSYSPSTASMYVNTTVNTAASSGYAINTSDTTGFAIGGHFASTSQGFIGSIDEVRVASVVRTADWLQAEYAVSDPANQGIGAGKFVQSVGSETPVSAPSVTTSAASSITTTTATLNSSVNGNGGNTSIYYRYGTSNVACASLPTQVLFSSGIFGSSSPNAVGISSLTQNTTYYFCAYGVNNGGTTYGNVLSFTTAAATPTITTPTKASITHDSATLGGNITAQGGSAVTARGVCISTTDNTPTIAEGATCTASGSGTGVFTVGVTGLSASTLYYYAAYATNTQGTAYTSTDSFTTATNLPSGATADDPTGVNSYYVTLVGGVNPNGFSNTKGHFRVFTSSPANCNADSGGTRFPYNPDGSQDVTIPANSTTTAYSFTIPLSGGIFLEPNTTYYYCSYTYNSNGFTGSSNIKQFTTPDGPASPCDPPTSGNITIPATAACTFNTNYSGVDAGSGTTNTASLTVQAGSQLTVGASQRIGRGSLLMQAGGNITLAQGGVIVRGGVFANDADGDGTIDSQTQYVGSSPPVGYVRRNTLSTTYNYAWKMAIASIDCNPNSAYANRYIPGVEMVTDADNDGYKTSAAASTQCVGAQSTINGRTYYKDASNASSWLPDAQKLSATTDCQDDPSGTPCAPSSVSASNPSSQTQNNVTFSGTQTGGAVPASTGYDLKWCTGGSCSPSATLTNVTSVYNHVFAANPSTTYGYAVAGKNAAGTGTYSTPTQYVTTAAACTNTTIYPDTDGDSYGNSGTIYQGAVMQKYNNSFSSSIVITKPADIVNGELMIAVIGWGGGSGRTITGVPSGWTQIGSTATNGTATNIAAYYKYASGEGANYTWNFSSSEQQTGFITSYGNAILSPSNPVDVSSTSTGTSTNLTVTGVSLNNANEMLVMAVSVNPGAATVTVNSGPAGMNEIAKMNSNFGDQGGAGDILAAYSEWRSSGGVTGDKTAVLSTSKAYAGIIFALKRPAQVSDVQCLTGGPPGGWVINNNDCDDTSSSYYQTQATSRVQDFDTDGQGIGSQMTLCKGASTRPGTATNNNLDCYDSNANAYLGSGYSSSTNRGDGSFDYNCNGSNDISTEYTSGEYSGQQGCSFSGFCDNYYKWFYPSYPSYQCLNAGPSCSGSGNICQQGGAVTSSTCGQTVSQKLYGSDSSCTTPSGNWLQVGNVPCY